MSEVRSNEITPAIAQHVLWHYGHGGLQPGRFVARLLEAYGSADPINKAGLALGFPGYCQAMDLASGHVEGMYLLYQVVNK